MQPIEIFARVGVGYSRHSYALRLADSNRPTPSICT